MKEKINVKIQGAVFLFFLFLLIFTFQIPMKVFAEKPTKNELAEAIADETSARQEADATLQDNIDAETIAREAGDQASQAAIEEEALARGAEDTTLQGAIDAGVIERNKIVESMRFFIPPPALDLYPTTCLAGSTWFCVNYNGELLTVCPNPDFCDPNIFPDPSLCPEACEDLGRVVVPDLSTNPCGAPATVYLGFVCMTQEEYDLRPSCQEGTILNYDTVRGGWVCDVLVPPVAHVTTDIYDLVGTISLFERARTDLTDEDLQSQIDNINLCECPGVFAPVCGSDNNTYVNSCEAKCANQTVVHSGVCVGN